MVLYHLFYQSLYPPSLQFLLYLLVFDNRDQEIKHYSTVVGTRNEAGEYKVEDLGEVKLDELAGFVKSYKRSKFVGVMPNHQVFTRYVRLPAATPENLVKMVGFEAQSIPFPMSEVLWGYNQFSSASSTKKGEYEVRLIALKKDTAEKYFPYSTNFFILFLRAFP